MKSHYLILFMAFCLSCENTEKQASSAPVLYDYDVEQRIDDLGIVLQPPTAPVANYVNAVTTGKLVFLAGKGPSRPDGSRITGKVGIDMDIEAGNAAARRVGIAQLASLKEEIGDLNRVVRIVKVLGMVNADSSFTQHPEVINGFSDLMVEVFGRRGKHAG